MKEAVNIPVNMKQQLRHNDAEDLLLDNYFLLKAASDAADRRELIIRHNILVRIIHAADPLKGYRQLFV